MNELSFFLLTILTSALNCAASDVLGCGGFIKSHVQIDFSKVEVKLLTKQGILKDKTNCAPNNGYYFIPLYEKGEYILELEPPAGWSFTPTQVNLNVDGATDLCTEGKDINFVFKGFGITGKVESLGSDRGPKGVQVSLKSDTETRSTTTDENGSFFFTPVYPGSYVVSISHAKWKIFKESVAVKVTEGNTDLPAKSLLVQGYSASGFIKSDGEAVVGTSILLFQKGPKLNVEGCDKQVPNVELQGLKAVCLTKSSNEGRFTFGVLPNGNYLVKPYYKEQNIHFKPLFIEFAISHGDVLLGEHFEIIGFNLAGSVLKASNGSPLPNADIFLDNKLVAHSDIKGNYQLNKLKVGNYKLRAEAEGYQIHEIPVRIVPSSTKLPDLIPSSFEVCGKVVTEQSQTVSFSKPGLSEKILAKTDPTSGQFCTFLPPGKYEAQVVVTGEPKGLQFFPIKQTVEVNHDTQSNIVFSQLKATISGKVQCFSEKYCEGLQVSVKALDAAEGQAIIVALKENVYTVSNIYPGTYEVRLLDNKYCWRSNKQQINVNSVKIEVPPFIQLGFNVNFVSSHKTQVSYKLGDKAPTIIDLIPGSNTHCLEKEQEYTFQLQSCHVYETNTIKYHSSNSESNEVKLTALKHLNKIQIKPTKQIGTSLTVSVKIGNDKVLVNAPYKNGQYELQLSLAHQENAVLVPQSDIFYFQPPILSINGYEDCTDLGSLFSAIVGKVFSGKIVPPLEGVVVTVDTDNADSLIAETDKQGTYKFPPLDDTKNYKVSAKKDSYVLSGPDEQGTFLAHKLAEIVVEVISELDKAPLQNALLSLSGGESYRSNLQTNDNGKITFNSLSPDVYFLRPMMKEYMFEPTSKIIQVKEGQTVNVQLVGKRVAYSAFGKVTSLNGIPEENMIVVAEGTGNCSHFSEESTSEITGHFRVRGLQPYCDYDIKVKESNNGKVVIERSTPQAIHIESVKDDVENLKIITFRAASQMDILVKVFAENPEHYKSLKVKITRESAPSTLVHISKVDTLGFKLTKSSNNGVLIQALSVPVDGRTYALQLESTLSQPSKWKPDTVYVTANSSFQYVELKYVVKNHVTEQNIKQTSIWTLLVILTAIATLYNVELVARVLKEQFNFNISGIVNLLPSSSPKKPSEYYDNAEIDQIVQTINNVKRKPKPKKI